MRKAAQAQILTIVALVLLVAVVVGRDRFGNANSVDVDNSPALFSRPGADEPLDAVYRMLDAAGEGDAEGYIACFGGDTRERLEQSREEMGPSGFAQYLKERNRDIKGIAINEPKRGSSNDALIEVEYVYQDRNESQNFYLEKQSQEWKIVGVDSAKRVKTLVPYGTPAQ